MSAESIPDRPGVVAVWSAVSWFHPLFQRPHQLCLALAARGFEVIYVEPEETGRSKPERVEVAGQTIHLFHFTEAAIGRGYARFIDLAQRALYRTRRAAQPLYRSEAKPRKLGIIRFFNERLRPAIRISGLAPLLERRLLSGPPGLRLLLVEYPGPGTDRVMRRLQRRGVLGVYDMLDDFQALGGHPSRARIERRLLRGADLVLATAGILEAEARKLNPRVLRVPNGVDPDHFRGARARGPLPEDWPFPRDGARVIGYAGAIWDWFDVDLLLHAARARRELRFVLVGMAQDGIRARLEAEPNIRLTGARPFAELPRWLGGFDVATIPFLLNEITRATNPVKVYEYLAAGLPVVSTDLPEVRGLPFVETALDPPGFVAALDRALQGRPDAEAIDRFLAGQTWQRRAEAILEAARAGPRR